MSVGFYGSKGGLSKRARDHPDIFAQGTLIANMHLGMHACVCIRLGYGVATIPPLDAITYIMFVFWVCDSDEYQHMEWQGMLRLDASQLLVPCGTTLAGSSFSRSAMETRGTSMSSAGRLTQRCQKLMGRWMCRTRIWRTLRRQGYRRGHLRRRPQQSRGGAGRLLR